MHVFGLCQGQIDVLAELGKQNKNLIPEIKLSMMDLLCSQPYLILNGIHTSEEHCVFILIKPMCSGVVFCRWIRHS